MTDQPVGSSVRLIPIFVHFLFCSILCRYFRVFLPSLLVHTRAGFQSFTLHLLYIHLRSILARSSQVVNIRFTSVHSTGDPRCMRKSPRPIASKQTTTLAARLISDPPRSKSRDQLRQVMIPCWVRTQSLTSTSWSYSIQSVWYCS